MTFWPPHDDLPPPPVGWPRWALLAAAVAVVVVIYLLVRRWA